MNESSLLEINEIEKYNGWSHYSVLEDYLVKIVPLSDSVVQLFVQYSVYMFHLLLCFFVHTTDKWAETIQPVKILTKKSFSLKTYDIRKYIYAWLVYETMWSQMKSNRTNWVEACLNFSFVHATC